MTAGYLGRHFFITNGKIVRLKIGSFDAINCKFFFKNDDNFYNEVVAALNFFAQNREDTCANTFFRLIALSLSETSQFFQVCQEIATANGITL